jgi:glycosyltransferase involved in cell wall biosynthesis
MDPLNNHPLVTIVIPTYNYATYLTKALESCITQSYKHLEIIIIDDGSTDNTEEIVRGIHDNRVFYCHQPNQGVSSARNRGLKLAKGDFITFLDADDYLSDGSIEQRLHVMFSDSDIDFVITTSYSEDDSGNIVFHDNNCRKDTISTGLCEELLLKQIPFATCAILIRSSHAKKFEFPLHLTNGEDLVYFSKVFFRTKGCFLSSPTAVIWSHTDSLRHNIADLKVQRTGLVETIFDDPYFEGKLDHIRATFTANRCFELFRRFYRSGDKALARQYYGQAISIQPARIFKVDYLLKFLRTYL